MLNALTNVRFWGQSGPVTNRCLPISISQYTAKLALKTEKEKDAKAGSKVGPREGKNRKRRWRPKKRERQ
jgi:hypothetical protein